MPAKSIIEEVDDHEETPRRCPHCVGGRIEAESGSTLGYRCPDCGGTGRFRKPEYEFGTDEVEESTSRKLLESILRGEWWIFEDGDIHYCDGDVGDVNHEGYAISHAMSKVLDQMGLNSDQEDLDRDSFLEAIKDGFIEDEATEEERAAVESDEMDEFDAASRMAEINKVPEHLLDVALGRGDPRLYAMQHWGWHALRNDQVETWEITSASLPVISKGIMNALDENGEEEVDPEAEFHIIGAKGRRSIALTYQQLEAEDFGEGFKPAPQAPSDQVKKLDQKQAPDFYKGNLGDSALRIVNTLLDGSDSV